METDRKRVRKPPGEEQIERLTVGGLLLAIVPALLHLWPAPWEGLSAVLVGLVLLGSAFYQRGRGWPVGRVTWFVAPLAIGLGLVSVASGGRIHSATAMAVVLLGVWFMGRGMGLET
jgi:hypothetical protein